MKISFAKYQGTGNDFILLDNRDSRYSGLKNKDVAFLCDRKFGVGADGLILLEKRDGFDFNMKYYNSDGNLSSMCGNGGRCITAFASTLQVISTKATFTAVDGDHQSIIISSSPLVVKLKMRDVNEAEKIGNDLFLNTGSPHYICFVNDVMKVDVFREGRKIRNSERFVSDGTNVNFVQITNTGLIVRSYERGVEDETLSCGTGVTASVIGSAFRGSIDSVLGNCAVKSMGGDLKVYFERNGNSFKNIWLEGEATFVFSGEIDWP